MGSIEPGSATSIPSGSGSNMPGGWSRPRRCSRSRNRRLRPDHRRPRRWKRRRGNWVGLAAGALARVSIGRRPCRWALVPHRRGRGAGCGAAGTGVGRLPALLRGRTEVGRGGRCRAGRTAPGARLCAPTTGIPFPERRSGAGIFDRDALCHVDEVVNRHRAEILARSAAGPRPRPASASRLPTTSM